MKRNLGTALFVIGFLVLAQVVVAVDAPDMANSNSSKSWVYRRNKDEPNKIGAVFTYLHLEDRSDSRTQKVRGTLTIWTTGTVGGNYTGKKTWNLPEVTINNSVNNTRKREYCRWDASTSPPVPTGGNTDNINVYASLFKGNNKGHGHANRRFVVRCLPPSRAPTKDNKSPTYGDCDEEPDDDVLEEENNPPDPPPYDDP